MGCSSNTTGEWRVVRWYRWLCRRCMDCGVKLDQSYDRGDVCKKCFDDFNGMTLEELCR